MDAMPMRQAGCPSDLELEQRRFSDHIAGCASCGARLEWMRQAGAYFSVTVLPRTRERVSRRLVPARGERRWLWAALAFPVAALAASLVLIVRQPEDYVGNKGSGEVAA